MLSQFKNNAKLPVIKNKTVQYRFPKYLGYSGVWYLFKTSMSKYKPVRLTSVLCMVMEKLIRKKIIEHEHSKSLQKQTVRFISGRST